MKKFRSYLYAALLMLSAPTLLAQQRDAVDTAMVSKFRKEGLKNSRVMEILSMLTDMNGPRLTNSPGYKNAANYAKSALEGWGVGNVHFDSFGPFGRGWFVKKFSLQVMAPVYFSVIGYPKAWSPGVKGTHKTEAIYLDVKTEEDLEKYKGKLKGKIVLFDFPIMPKPAFKPDATRLTDSTLLKMANAAASNRSGGSRRRFAAGAPEMLTYKKWRLCESEGALAVMEGSRGSYGTFYASAATVPIDPTATGARVSAQAANAPEILPQIVVAAEHYNRLVRQLQQGLTVKLELALETEFTKPEDGFNVIGEIPGTDKKEEVVMFGAHLDSWHSGTGTTDNAVGVAICMEAMRLLKAAGVQPSRTIRIGLWGGEEQGLLGSTGYVKKHLGERVADSVKLTAEGEKFSVYFNTDNGGGRWRGVYLQGNENVRPVFREWLKPFEKDGTSTLSLSNTGSTDHIPFDNVGLPGFQFITDPIEYFARSWHSSMDMYERAVEADLKQNAVMLATFAIGAANREGLMPRK